MNESIAAYERTLKYGRPPDVAREYIDRELGKIAGINQQTGKPYLRFVWGMDRLEWCNGEQIRRYPDPEGKYVGMPFWILEGWQSPSVFDRLEWAANESTLGPFPEQGEWDFVDVIRTSDGKFLNLGPRALEIARNWRYWRQQPRKVAIEHLMEGRRRLSSLREMRAREAMDKIFAEMTEEVDRAMSKPQNSAYSLPSKPKKEENRTPSGLIILPSL